MDTSRDRITRRRDVLSIYSDDLLALPIFPYSSGAAAGATSEPETTALAHRYGYGCARVEEARDGT